MTKLQLYPYQKRAASFIIKKKKCALFLDMGMGKTIISLVAIKKMINNLYATKVLIIAPLRVANTTWPNEIDKWEEFKDLSYKLCTGSAKNRIDAINSKVDIHIINKENIPWLIKNVAWKWDTVIIDESSAFKSHSAQRFKAMKAVTKYIDNMVLLTGTPNPQSYLDLWPQLYLIDNGERLGRNITQYRNQYFKPHPRVMNKWNLIVGQENIIKSRISDVCMSMLQKDYLDLPDLIYLDRVVPMSDSMKEMYKEFKKDFVLSIDDIDIVASQAATLKNKLLQCCNGAIYDNDKNVIHINDDKIKELRDIIEENPSENFLVAYSYQSDLIRLKKEFKGIAKVLDKSGSVQDQWNKGNIRMLLAHPASAGHGLNLQFGGNNIVWFGLNWSLELYQQFNKRLHRPGQQKPVKIIHLITDAIEEHEVAQALQSKAKTQQELLDYLKAKLF